MDAQSWKSNYSNMITYGELKTMVGKHQGGDEALIMLGAEDEKGLLIYRLPHSCRKTLRCYFTDSGNNNSFCFITWFFKYDIQLALSFCSRKWIIAITGIPPPRQFYLCFKLHRITYVVEPTGKCPF